MKKNCFIFSFLFSFVFIVPKVGAEITLPADMDNPGVDGDLAYVRGSVLPTTIDLDLAQQGVWNGGSGGNGIYDPDKWAVVFKYSSVNIESGFKINFSNHRSRAPIVWIVSGDVVIDGEINLSGSSGRSGQTYPEPGPGGFRGGSNAQASAPLSHGFGPGGGIGSGASTNADTAIKGGCYKDTENCQSYGNDLILPLIGGSGGSGTDWGQGSSGGGGGGAILIVATGKITINGRILSLGGNAYANVGGSGGAIRLVADEISGTGSLDVRTTTNSGGNGRIRIETNSMKEGLETLPPIVPVNISDTVLIWPPLNAPAVSILSVNQIQAPEDPVAGLLSIPDVLLSYTDQIEVLLATSYVASDGIVKVRYIPKNEPESEYFNATYQSGPLENSIWEVTMPMNHDHVVLQAIAENLEQ